MRFRNVPPRPPPEFHWLPSWTTWRSRVPLALLDVSVSGCEQDKNLISKVNITFCWEILQSLSESQNRGVWRHCVKLCWLKRSAVTWGETLQSFLGIIAALKRKLPPQKKVLKFARAWNVSNHKTNMGTLFVFVCLFVLLD